MSHRSENAEAYGCTTIIVAFVFMICIYIIGYGYLHNHVPYPHTTINPR